MECYKEYPRSIGALTCLGGSLYLMAGSVLMLGLSRWFAAGFMILFLLVHLVHYPRSACVNCYYYGRYCISLKGMLSRKIYQRGRENLFSTGMKRARTGLYILWIYPFLVLIGTQLRGRPILVHDLLLAAVLIVIMVMRQLMRRSLGCRVCMMREDCPNIGADPRRGVKIATRAPDCPGN
jgi:hypothetical protein